MRTTQTGLWTGLWIIVFVLATMFCAYMVYTSLTAETHEQCIAGDETRDYQECWEYETRPGPDIKAAFFFAFISIIPITFTVQLIRNPRVQLIRNPRQRRNVTPTPWWAFWK